MTVGLPVESDVVPRQSVGAVPAPCIYIYIYMVALPQDFRRCDLQAWRRERQEKSSREGAFCSSSCLPSSRHSGLWLPVPLSGVNISWLRVRWLSFYGFVVGFLFRCQESVVPFVTFVLHFLSLSLCLLDVVLDFSHFNTPHALRLSSFLATVVEAVCIFDLSWFSGGFVICLHHLLDSFTLVVMVLSFLFFAPQSSVDCFLHPFIPLFSSGWVAVIKSSGQSALSTSGSAVALVALMAFFRSSVLVTFIILCPPLQFCMLSQSSEQSALSTSSSAVALVALIAFFCSYVLVLFIIVCPPLQSCVLSQSPEQSASSTSGSAVALVALIANFYSLMVLLCIFLSLVLSNVYDFGFKILRFDCVFRLLRAMPCWL